MADINIEPIYENELRLIQSKYRQLIDNRRKSLCLKHDIRLLLLNKHWDNLDYPVWNKANKRGQQRTAALEANHGHEWWKISRSPQEQGICFLFLP